MVSLLQLHKQTKTSTYAIGLENNQFTLEYENEVFQEEYLQGGNNRKGSDEFGHSGKLH